MSRSKRKIQKVSLIILCFILISSFLIGVVTAVDQYKISSLAMYAFASCFSDAENEEVIAFKEKNGIVKGVCHPTVGEREDILAANIEWVRLGCDSSLIYDENGFTDVFIEFLNVANYYKTCGLKVMCIYSATNSVHVAEGGDFRTEEGKKIIAERAVDFIKNVQGYVDGVQICNEIGLERFSQPYTYTEAVDYACFLLECMYPYKGDILLGVNSLALNCCSLFEKMQGHLQYMDYVGTDIYLGRFDPYLKELWVYDAILRAIYYYTQKPVILCEFGYIGLGEQKTAEEKLAILQQYGYNSEEEAKADFLNFVDKLNPTFRYNVLYSTPYKSTEELADIFFASELANHFYCELPASYYVNGYPHTSKGQADCVYDIIGRLKNMPFVCGAFVYCYMPTPSCYYCKSPDCPVETGWSLTDIDNNPTELYYSVQKAYKEW